MTQTETLLTIYTGVEVLKNADMLDDEIVDENWDRLRGMGIVGEVLAQYYDMSQQDWWTLIDNSFGRI